MIILRNKEFSTKLGKVLKTLKSAGDKTITAVDNAGLMVGDRLLGKKSNFRFKPKSNTKLNREALVAEKNIRSIPDKARQAAYTPIGQIADRGLVALAENPIASTGQVASVITPMINPAAAAIPIGSGSLAVEKGMKKSIKGYRKATEKSSKAYKNSKLSKRLRENLTPTLSDISAALPIV